MSVIIEQSAPEKIASADLKPRGRVYPSPVTWRDQVLYFLLPDRFSDGGEAQRQLFDRSNPQQFKTPDKRAWMEAGKKFQGGTLRGIKSKLDYLGELGVTTLWIGPVWQQRPDLETYHGYGIQNFLEIDSRFGTRQDLRDLVDAAHDRGIYVLLDVIYNHTGNNWFYDVGGVARETVPYRFEPPYSFHGWRSSSGSSIPAIASLKDGVWPEDFQDINCYTRAGRIGRWDPESWEDPLHPDCEFRRGDFCDLKDLNLDKNQKVFSDVILAYQYWIALSDCDGFRIDTVKHVSWEASRNFCGAIREYAESIGKENFLLLAEVTGGGEMARNYLDIFGRNIDAVLDIGDPAKRLAGVVQGLGDASDFFQQFGGHDILGGHRETGRYHISILDDHDMIARAKCRFAALDSIPNIYQRVAHAVGMQLTTLGIPCVYYGTEQAFDGTENRHETAFEPRDQNGQIPFVDRYIRESMFGSVFGAFETSFCHFFDSRHPTFLRIAAINRVRNRQDPIGLALRRGRQYLRETSVDNVSFTVPGRGEIVAWSRILNDEEVLVALNTHGQESRSAYVTIHAPWYSDKSTMTFLYKGDWSDAQLQNPPLNETASVTKTGNRASDRATIKLNLPPAGMAILA